MRLLTIRKLTILVIVAIGGLLLSLMRSTFNRDVLWNVLETACDLQTRDVEDAQTFVQRFRRCRDLIVDTIRRGAPLPQVFEQDLEYSLMAQRARRLVEAETQCATRALPSTPVADSWVLASLPHRVAYCQLEKTASSTMLTFLLEINGKQTHFKTNDDLHHTAWALFKQNEDVKEQIAREFFSYTQVRHPFSRLVSGYCGKVLERRFAFVKMFWKFRQRRGVTTLDVVRTELPGYRFSSSASKPFSNDDGSSFLKIISPPGKDEFLARRRYELQPPVARTPSFREFAINAAVEILACETNQTCRTLVHASYGRQVDHCDPCSWSFDIIMKIETMKHDFHVLRRLVGETGHFQHSPRRDSAPLEGDERIVNGHISECKTTEEYLLELTSEEIDLLYTAYHEDFLLLGYEPFVFD